MTHMAQGLAPCFNSIATPDIPESKKFKWTYRPSFGGDYQTRFLIYIDKWDGGGWPLVWGNTIWSSDNSYSFDSTGYTFENGASYRWCIQVWDRWGNASSLSDHAYFTYIDLAQKQQISWNSSTPQVDDVISNSYYFQDIKNNLQTLSTHYQGFDGNILSKINRLFTGDIVPLRQDFQDIQDILMYVGQLEGISYDRNTYGRITRENRPSITPRTWNTGNNNISPITPWNEGMPSTTGQLNTIGTIEDNDLGIQDIKSIDNYLSMLTHIPPDPVHNVSINPGTTNMYSMQYLNVYNTDRFDSSIDTWWDVNGFSDPDGQINFDDVSHSKDVYCYDLIWEIPSDTGTIRSQLFYRPQDLQNHPHFTIHWEDLVGSWMLNDLYQQITVSTIDQTFNVSNSATFRHNMGWGFKTPLGVNYFELQFQKSPLSWGWCDPNGWWGDIYNGGSHNFTHWISGGEGKFWYRIRAIDWSGLTTDWCYGNTCGFWNPIVPPPAPRNFRCTGSSTNSLDLAWDWTNTATGYEVWTEASGGYCIYNSNGTNCTAWNLHWETSYDWYLRAYNEAGYSGWVRCVGKTKEWIITQQWGSIHTHSYIISGIGQPGYLGNEGVNHTYVYQGTYKYHRSNCKMRGIMYFDYGDIQNTLQNKEVLHCRVYMTRNNGGSGKHTPGIYLGKLPNWIDNADYPYIYSDRSGGFHDGPSFSEGQGQWTGLPKRYGEKWQEGSVSSVIIWDDDGAFMRFANWGILEITYRVKP